jgi:hypothetical protein
MTDVHLPLRGASSNRDRHFLSSRRQFAIRLPWGVALAIARVEGVLFTGPKKLTMATIGKEHFENGTCRIRQGHLKLRADLHSMKKFSGHIGAPRFLAKDESNTSDSHADRAWADFLGLLAASGEVAQYGL